MKPTDQERIARLRKALQTELTEEARAQVADELEPLVMREMYRAELRRLPKPQLEIDSL